MEWIHEYLNRLSLEIKRNEIDSQGNILCRIYIYDLLDESGLTKSEFYNKVFALNKIVNDKVVLYLK